LSQLEGAAYAQQMDGWLKAAQPLDPAINIQQYCAITQPADADTSDLLVHYSDQAGFTALAKKLPPMLFDHKVCQPEMSVCLYVCVWVVGVEVSGKTQKI